MRKAGRTRSLVCNRTYNQAPSNRTLGRRMLMMVLRRQRDTGVVRDLFTTALASKNAGALNLIAGLVNLIENRRIFPCEVC